MRPCTTRRRWHYQPPDTGSRSTSCDPVSIIIEVSRLYFVYIRCYPGFGSLLSIEKPLGFTSPRGYFYATDILSWYRWSNPPSHTHIPFISGILEINVSQYELAFLADSNPAGRYIRCRGSNIPYMQISRCMHLVHTLTTTL